ncbi:DNA-binding response regulator [Nonlabens spongiae]|uniref:DNA-binding response regulator n=1 Tax=Nonlabens spongiae TaxID=331648 RepID=A0A1W6MPU8_9FLAO|nr:LytTR family DNA-binding domain-containing protein [Nonlabens spongiae]ARN79509.1 DNA-binding response regulator [Nonlabens spongiae]
MPSTLLNCYVVEPLDECRSMLVNLINAHPNLNFIQDYKNPVQAKEELQDTKIDLLIVAIEMEKMNGFELVNYLDSGASIIFTSFNTDDAFKAFEYNALDYLKLPIKKERFLYAAEKAILKKRFNELPKEDPGDFIFVKSNLKSRKVYLNELRYIQALGDYVKLITNHETLVVLSTMKAFEQSLPSDKFQRIHKSYIVNMDKIQKYSSTAVELDNEVLPLSRNRKTQFLSILKELEAVGV